MVEAVRKCSRFGQVTSKLVDSTLATELDKRIDVELNANILRSCDGHASFRHEANAKNPKMYFKCAKY